MIAATLPKREKRGLDLARLRIMLTYRWRHGRWPDLKTPKTFTELIQCRKRDMRDSRMPPLADKVRAKDHVGRILGPEWITPTLWHGTALPTRPKFPVPFVVKSRHGCNQRAFVRTGTEDWASIRRRSVRWMRKAYGGWLDEWAYGEIPRGVLVEPFVGDGTMLPVDWKIYVFSGRACFVQVHLDRENDHRWVVMDRHWVRASSPSRDCDPTPPASLPRMIEAAERLGGAFDFVRVDFFDVEGQPRFSEMTFYPGSGLDPFDPVSLDARMGQAWLSGGLSER